MVSPNATNLKYLIASRLQRRDEFLVLFFLFLAPLVCVNLGERSPPQNELNQVNNFEVKALLNSTFASC